MDILTFIGIILLCYIIEAKLTAIDKTLKESNKILNLIQSSAWRKL